MMTMLWVGIGTWVATLLCVVAICWMVRRVLRTATPTEVVVLDEVTTAAHRRAA